MSGLLALLDDVAAIAKLAASSVDDVVGGAAKAGAKAAGAVIDDAAVTPQYVEGIPATRELPMVGRIALGSIRNKLLVLLPAALALSVFAPWLISPLLMLGGGYLAFEGAEKVWHWLRPPAAGHAGHAPAAGDPAHLEQQRVAGAIKTDFILSAEIMTIALSALPQGSIWTTAGSLALVAVAITALVYGSVALIVKADDLGLLMARHGRLRVGRALGRAIVRGMPGFLTGLTTIGTAAMLWVGGSILIHGAEALGWATPAHWLELAAEQVAHAVPAEVAAVAAWSLRATLEGLIALGVGLMLMPVGKYLIAPVWQRLFGQDKTAGGH